MSRTKNFFYNSLSVAIFQIINMIISFIIPKTMLMFYGSETNGLVSSITQFISYFSLVEAGLSGAAIYSLYKPLAENDYRAINEIVSAARKFYIKAGYIFALLILVLSITYPIYIKSNLLSSINIYLLVLISGVSGVLDFFILSKYNVLLTADQKTYVLSISSILTLIANAMIIIVLAFMKIDIVVLKFISMFSVFIRLTILMIYCKKKYRFLNFKSKPNNRALNKRWNVLYLQVLGLIQIGAPIVLITLILKDLKLVSVYTIYNMVISGVNGLLGIFISGLAASFGDVIAKRQVKVLQKSFKDFEFAYYLLMTWIYAVAFIMIMPFINIYTSGITDANYNMPIIGFMFVLNGFLYNVKTPQGMLVISAGLYKETKWQTTTQGLIALVFGAIFALFFGIYGILLAQILSNLYRDIDLLFFIPKKLTKLPARESFLRVGYMIVCILLVCFPFIFFRIGPNSYIGWIYLASVITIYAFFVILVFNFMFNKNELKDVLKRIKGILRLKI